MHGLALPCVANICIFVILDNFCLRHGILKAMQFQKIGVYRELPGGAGISHYRPNECFMGVNLMLALNRLLLKGE
jgi:hypothetical protein